MSSKALEGAWRQLFAGREWPTNEQITAIQGRENWSRDWSYNVPVECRHGLMQGFETDTGWFVDVCVTCGHVERARCQHVEFEWNDAGTLLRCVVCGHDGT